MNKSKLIKYVIICIIACITVLIALYIFYKYRPIDLIKYTEKTLDIEWSDYIASVDGDVERNILDGDFANIRIEPKVGCEDEVIKVLTDRCYKLSDEAVASHVIYGYENHRLALELKTREVKYIFKLNLGARPTGKEMRQVCIYAAEDENHKMYIYLFG